LVRIKFFKKCKGGRKAAFFFLVDETIGLLYGMSEPIWLAMIKII